MMHSICAMQENRHKCVEEIRFDAYAKAGEPSPQGASPGTPGQPATSATFERRPKGFGANVGTGGVGFGSTAFPLLGSPSGGSFAPWCSSQSIRAAGSAFGASAGSASPFGVTAPSSCWRLWFISSWRVWWCRRGVGGRRNIWS